jgi:DNA-repair protein XRCC1
VHVAENLLKKETTRKWNSAEPGEKTLSVILQLEKATIIDGMDIGNDGSAFVEVLVGRSGSTSDDGYQVLLVTSSFMSPSESKSNSNTNRVRMFGKDSLSKSLVDQKWDRVKIICTQPYNKNIKYGLVFIRLHGPANEANISLAPKEKVMLGAFKLRDDLDSEGLHVGSMFESQRTGSVSKPNTSAAASARAASTRAASASSDPGSHGKDTLANKRPMASAAMPVVLSRTEENLSNQLQPSAKRLRPEASISNTASSPVPFNNIMKGVRFALSGFKNPYRGELRDKALAMGAKYEPDWGPNCTHLVCAFPNTPKFNQVKADRGIGVIVRQEWIIDCHRRRTRLPASWYVYSQRWAGRQVGRQVDRQTNRQTDRCTQMNDEH